MGLLKLTPYLIELATSKLERISLFFQAIFKPVRLSKQLLSIYNGRREGFYKFTLIVNVF